MRNFLFVLFLCPAILLAQDSTAVRPNSLQDGKWSLLFGESGLLNFTTFATDVSLKQMISASSAWRYGFSLATSGTSGFASASRSQSFALLAQSIHYASTTDELLFYYGFGPQVSYSNSQSSYTSSSDNWSASTTLSISVGATGLAGVEWFATKSISASLEYRMAFTYSRTHDYSEENPPYIAENYSLWGNTWSVSDRGILFGVNLYFGKPQ
jgi:opacity protein-like surface antigen